MNIIMWQTCGIRNVFRITENVPTVTFPELYSFPVFNSSYKIIVEKDGILVRTVWYQNGLKHSSENNPAIIWQSGTKEWYRNSKRHRDNAPAVINAIGNKYWYQNGQLHRTNGPAIEFANGNKHWYVDGKLHREDGPAIENTDGTQQWRKNGVLINKPIK